MSGRRVLVIDDNDDYRNWLADELRAKGWNVAAARTGKLALDLAATHQPEVVVTELVLPDVRGMYLPRALRSIVEHDVRMIAVTRLPDEIQAQARLAGFDHVQSKSANVDELHERMAS